MPGGEVLAERPGRGIHPAEVGLGLVVDEERHHQDHRVGAGNGVGVVGRGAQAPGGNQFAQVLLKVGLAGERLLARVDQVDHRSG